MPNQVTRYACKFCQVEYHTVTEAESCEEKHMEIDVVTPIYSPKTRFPHQVIVKFKGNVTKCYDLEES